MPIKHDPSFLKDCQLLTADCIQFVSNAEKMPEEATQEKRYGQDEVLASIDQSNRRDINKRWNDRHPETRAEIQKRYAESEKGRISFKISALKNQINSMNQTIEKKHVRVQAMKDEIKALDAKRSML